MTDNAKLFHELSVHLATLAPEIDEQRLLLRLEEVLSNYNVHHRQADELATDIEEKAMMFLSALEFEGASKTTLASYFYTLRQFWRSCPKACSQVTVQDVRHYLQRFPHTKASTVGTKLTVLNSFFSWLVKEEILLRSPTLKVKAPKVGKRNPKGLTIEQLERARDACETLRQRALLEVAYSTGCRLSEIYAMDRDDLDLHSLSMSVIGKGNKERTVFLSQKAYYHLAKYLDSRQDNCPALFVTQRRPTRRMERSTIQDEINKIEKGANLEVSLTPHVLRHTFANLSMEAGIELADLQHLLGHSNPATTLIYASLSDERKKQAFKKFHVQ